VLKKKTDDGSEHEWPLYGSGSKLSGPEGLNSTQKYDKVCASIFLHEPLGNTKAYRQYFAHSVNHKSPNKYN